jgi:hypothetical protein
MGLFFIPQGVYEYREPRWNDINRRKPLINLPELSGNSTILGFVQNV